MMCFVALGFRTVTQAPQSQLQRLFVAICISGAILFLGILLVFNCDSPTMALPLARTGQCAGLLLIPLFLHFFHVYLGVDRRFYLVAVAYGLTIVLAFCAPTPMLIATMQAHFFGWFGKAGPLYPVVTAMAAATIAYVLVLLAIAVHRQRSTVARIRLLYILAGFGTSGLLIGCSTLTVQGASLYPPGNWSFLPLAVLGIGLFKHDLLDRGTLFRRAGVFGALALVLLAIYALASVVLTTSASEGLGEGPGLVPALLCICLMPLAWGPARRKLEQITPAAFSTAPFHKPDLLRHTSRILVSKQQDHQVAGQIMDKLVSDLQIAFCALYYRSESQNAMLRYSVRGTPPAAALPSRFGPGDEMVRYLDQVQRPVVFSGINAGLSRHRDRCNSALLAKHGIGLLLPVHFQDRLAGMVMLGEKRGGRLFSRQEISELTQIARQGALAIENTRSYRRLDGLNRQLESRVKERTRDLEQALADKKRTQQRLIRSESLAAIGQLVAGTAHELNNPLASVTSLVQSAIEELEEETTEPAARWEMLEDLKVADRELRRARDIISSLLDLSRQTRSYSESVAINRAVGDALQVLTGRIKRANVAIELQQDQHLPEVTGNFSALGQVVLNLIANALDAVSPGSGKIRLTTSYRSSGSCVRLTVDDNGPGVPEAIRGRIFNPFFTTKPVGSGTGLGLYICHEIVTRHGGTVTQERSAWGGARFVVDLKTMPRVADGIDSRESAAAPAANWR
jgi:signal transduction histidine kinase